MRIIVERLRKLYRANTLIEKQIIVAVDMYKLTPEEVTYILEDPKDE